MNDLLTTALLSGRLDSVVRLFRIIMTTLEELAISHVATMVRDMEITPVSAPWVDEPLTADEHLVAWKERGEKSVEESIKNQGIKHEVTKWTNALLKRSKY